MFCVLAVAAGVARADLLDDARRDIRAQRFDDAEASLVRAARDSEGRERQEALFLLAGLKTSVSEAQIIYQEVIDLDPGSEWGADAQLELAKIEYAVGHYDRAFNILEAGELCGGRDPEACYFKGLSASQLNRYEIAADAFSRVRHGRFESWAHIALAEIDMNENRMDEACRQYRSMSRTAISPTAMFRYGECLEKMGDGREATEVFERLLRDFPDTQEALLAREKVDVLTRQPSAQTSERPEVSGARPADIPTNGFTLQFGAFHDRANAIRLAAELKRKLPGVRIDSDLVNYKEVHRVRFGYFRTREEAQKKGEEISAVVAEPFSIMTLR